MTSIKRALLILTLLALAACSRPPAPAPVDSTATPAPTDPPPTATSEPTAPPTETEPAATDEPTAEPTAEGYAWPAPVEAQPEFTRVEVSTAELAVYELLDTTNYAPNDPIALAVSISGAAQPEPPPSELPQRFVGQTEEFWIHNTETLEWTQIEAQLLAISEHAYFWFDTERDIDPEAAAAAAEVFEMIYEEVRAVFGEEPSPGIDGDPRIYVMHASPLALCNVTVDTAHNCGLLGYFSTTDTLPSEIDEHSNEHEMFVLNIDRLPAGGANWTSTLVHEFRHMIEHNYDRHDDDWEVEGTAVVSQFLHGDTSGPRGRANAYVANTDLQMNAWTQGNSNPHYGKGYVFSSYLLGRFGLDWFSAWVQHPDRALFAIDAVLDDFGYEISALDVWADFTAAVALIGEEGTAPEYSFAPEFESDEADTTPINRFPSETGDTVSQFGFDIYRIFGSEPVQIDFIGSTKTAVLEGTLPASGEYMWWSGRANQSEMSLTREFDLSGVDSATLNFATNYSLEGGYDFAYLLASTDGGETWEPLVSENMEGEGDRDDPGELALTERFYNGRSGEWLDERIDLSAYAGGTVLIRFLYVTDAIYTAPGMAIDNISIPEIDFYDDVENGDDGWVADGFLRVTAYIPQTFFVTLVTFDTGAPVVERMEIAADNTGTFQVPFENSSQAVLIVSAANPLIQTPASYQIEASLP